MLWTMLTHVHGSLLNVSDLARSLGVSSHTVAGDLDVLEGTFMIRRLPPYFANVQKRLTKSPKLYVRDTGLLHFLAGLRRPRELATWPRRGSSFEGLVIEELVGLAQRAPGPARALLLAHAGRCRGRPADRRRPARSSRSRSSSARRSTRVAGRAPPVHADLGLKRGFVVNTGSERRSIGGGIEVIPWREIARREVELG